MWGGKFSTVVTPHGGATVERLESRGMERVGNGLTPSGVVRVLTIRQMITTIQDAMNPKSGGLGLLARVHEILAHNARAGRRSHATPVGPPHVAQPPTALWPHYDRPPPPHAEPRRLTPFTATHTRPQRACRTLTTQSCVGR